jgi:hypothetical protein
LFPKVAQTQGLTGAVFASIPPLPILVWSTTMGLNNPVLIYRAANNLEANLIKLKLSDAGIDAHVIEDDSMIASEGIIPGVLRPQVYVDESTTAQAKAVIEEYEREAKQNPTRDS